MYMRLIVSASNTSDVCYCRPTPLLALPRDTVIPSLGLVRTLELYLLFIISDPDIYDAANQRSRVATGLASVVNKFAVTSIYTM